MNSDILMNMPKKSNETAAKNSEVKEVKKDKVVKGKVGRPSKQADDTAKLDVVEQARLELARLEAEAKNKSQETAFPWGVFCGAVVLTLAVVLIGWKAVEMYQISKLQAKLPEIVEPLGGGMTLEEIGKPVNQSGVYRFTIKFEEYEEEFTSYITRDAKTFFVDGYDVDELLGENGNTDNTAAMAQSCEQLTKSEHPVLDVYVSSECGYCKQAEVQIAQAVEENPALGEQIRLHYAGSVDGDNIIGFLGSPDAGVENTRQVCIQSEQHDVFWPYIACISDGGETETCMSEAGVDATSVNACMASEERGLGIIKADIARANELQVSGTPSFFLNDTDPVSDVEFGGGQRVPDAYKQIICCASSEEPDFCQEPAVEE